MTNIKKLAPPAIVIQAHDGRELLRLDLKTGEITGDVEDSSEAGKRFVAAIRQHLPKLKVEITPARHIPPPVVQKAYGRQLMDRWEASSYDVCPLIIQNYIDSMAAEIARLRAHCPICEAKDRENRRMFSALDGSENERRLCWSDWHKPAVQG